MRGGKFAIAIFICILAFVFGITELRDGESSTVPRIVQISALPAKIPQFNFARSPIDQPVSGDERREERGMDLTGVLGQRAMMSEKGRKISTCGVCFETGHNKRTCPREQQSDDTDGTGKRKKRGDGTCSICFARTHNKRTCPVERRVQELTDDSGEDTDDEQNQKRSVLLSLAQSGNTSSLSTLIIQGSHVDGGLRTGKRRQFEAPLHRASLFNHSDAAQKLIELGANINAQDEHGFTPLHVAAFRGFEGLVELLLEHKADVNASEEGGYTAIHYAAKQGWQSIVNLLMIAGADVDAATTKRQLTPLMLAAMRGEEACILQLAYGGANFSLRDDRKRTALAWATALGHRSTAHLIETVAAHPNPRGARAEGGHGRWQELLDPGDAGWKEIEGLSQEGLHDAWCGEPGFCPENVTDASVAAMEARGISVYSFSESADADSEEGTDQIAAADRESNPKTIIARP